MDTYQIRDYCEEALEIADQFGLHAGLSFLIGEKFCQEFYKFRQLTRKLKYLYPDQNDEPYPAESAKPFRLSYVLSLNENYQGVLERLRFLEGTLNNFVEEIGDCFDKEDIEEYLASYPRLGFKGAVTEEDWRIVKDLPMTKADILSEVEDILLVEDLKKLFVPDR
ncbi:MAG: hypothetical protein COV67_02755 [Nitrospinae bacterium CG11_big_fil_rev_8_21_14_0_20_56_8]|nr:MAG: hypothetical protein COV67_02755 [Nitrospinae bacterium CG11_big_fil_rev_8_21_14_0_20_56_8]